MESVGGTWNSLCVGEMKVAQWLNSFRRLVTRWEYHIENFLGFVHVACLHMLLRHL